MTLKSASGLIAFPTLRARFQIPGRAGATAFDVDSADAPYENVVTAPAGRVSASIGVMGVPGCWIRTRSLPLSPRAGVARAVRAASVK